MEPPLLGVRRLWKPSVRLALEPPIVPYGPLGQPGRPTFESWCAKSTAPSPSTRASAAPLDRDFLTTRGMLNEMSRGYLLVGEFRPYPRPRSTRGPASTNWPAKVSCAPLLGGPRRECGPVRLSAPTNLLGGIRERTNPVGHFPGNLREHSLPESRASNPRRPHCDGPPAAGPKHLVGKVYHPKKRTRLIVFLVR